jgi:hypothetical protein
VAPADAAMARRRGAAAVAVKGRRKRGAVAEVEGNILEERRQTRDSLRWLAGAPLSLSISRSF